MSELTNEELQEAELLNTQVDELASTIQSNEKLISSSWVKIGSLIYKIRSKKYWQVYGYSSFGSYAKSLEPKINRKRSQVYLAVGVIETLGDQIEPQNLESMGITKASVLRKYAKQSGKRVPQDLIDTASDENTSTEDIDATVSKLLHEPPKDKTTWYNFGGFYVSEAEKDEIEAAIELAKMVDPVVLHTNPEHIQRGEVFMKMCREFYGTYAAEAMVEA